MKKTLSLSLLLALPLSMQAMEGDNNNNNNVENPELTPRIQRMIKALNDPSDPAHSIIAQLVPEHSVEYRYIELFNKLVANQINQEEYERSMQDIKNGQAAPEKRLIIYYNEAYAKNLFYKKDIMEEMARVTKERNKQHMHALDKLKNTKLIVINKITEQLHNDSKCDKELIGKQFDTFQKELIELASEIKAHNIKANNDEVEYTELINLQCSRN